MISYYNPYFLICTFFGLGHLSKKFPGTIGSLIAIPVSYFLVWISSNMLTYLEIDSRAGVLLLMFSIIILIMLFIGIFASSKYVILTGQQDPKEVIIDEIVGQTLTILATVPITFIVLHELAQRDRIIIYEDVVMLISVIANLILFRFFDIFKPWPINLIDQKVKGGLGIMMDDVLAAIFAIVVYIAGLLVVIDSLS